MFISSLRARWLAALAAVACAVLLIPATSNAAPPGNNGTIKIDGIPFDDYPDNEPHVGCVFQVDFYNYEQGNYYGSVKFTAQPPTGKDILLVQNNAIFIGGDPAGGGTDLDGSITYDLSTYLQPYMAHPQQGYHIKLKVNAPYSIGKDTKYKTFWVQTCRTS